MGASEGTTRGQRLQQWLDAHGYGEWGGQKRFSEESGIRQQQLSRYLKDESEPVGKPRLQLAAMGVNLHWLDTGSGPMDSPSKYPSEVGPSGRITGAITFKTIEIDGKQVTILEGFEPDEEEPEDKEDK